MGTARLVRVSEPGSLTQLVEMPTETVLVCACKCQPRRSGGQERFSVLPLRTAARLVRAVFTVAIIWIVPFIIKLVVFHTRPGPGVAGMMEGVLPKKRLP